MTADLAAKKILDVFLKQRYGSLLAPQFPNLLLTISVASRY